MNSSVADNFTNSPEQCATGPTFLQFQVTTDVLVAGIVSCSLDVVCILTATPLNILVILAICLNSSLHHNADYVLLVLAASDFLLCAFLQPVLLVNKIQHLLSRPSCTTATVLYALRVTVSTASFTSEMLVSLEKAIFFMAPYWYQTWVTPRRLFAVPICVWFTFSLIELSRFLVLPRNTAPLVSACFVAVCLLVTAVCYGLLVQRVANYHENQVHAQQQVQCSEEEQKKKKREKIALWTALYINGAYFVCYLPLIPAAIIVATVDLSEKGAFLFTSWVSSLICLIAGVNPIILCWRNKRLCQEMRNLLRFGYGDNQADHPRVEPPP